MNSTKKKNYASVYTVGMACMLSLCGMQYLKYCPDEYRKIDEVLKKFFLVL